MAQTTVYIKAERNTQMQTDDVFLKDIASLYCEDKVVLARVKAIKLHTFHEKTGDQPAEGDPGDRKDLSRCQCGEHR